jgi:hypothetical protein
MHASVGREVQSNRVSSVLAAQLPAGPEDAGGQDLGDLIEALVGRHQVRGQRIGAGEASIEAAGGVSLMLHPVAIP